MSSPENVATSELQTVLDAAGTMMIACSPDGIVRIFNRAAERLLGWSAAEVVGHHTPSLWHDAEEIARRAAELSRELGRSVPADFEVFVAQARRSLEEPGKWTFVHKDGTRFPVQLTVSPIRDSAGMLTGYLGTVVDLTARVQAEQTLVKTRQDLAIALNSVGDAVLANEAARHSQATFASLSGVSPVGILLFDAAGRCIEVNHRWCEMSGFTLEQAQGDGWATAVHPEDRSRVRSQWTSAVQKKQPFASEHRLQPRGGCVTWVACHIEKIVNPHGEVTGYVWTLTDVSRQKQTEQALRFLSGMLVTLSGGAFYQAVTLQLAELLNVECVAVCTLAFQQPGHFATLAIAWDGKIQPNFVYPAAGTPCADVWERRPCIIPRQVQQQYPDDAYFVEKQIESFAGVPLIDSAGRQIGHISVLSRKVLCDPDQVESILSLFAVSVAAEMERQELSRNYSDLFELSPDAIILSNQEGIVIHANLEVEKLFGWKRQELIGQSIEVLMPPEDRVEHLELRQKYITAATPRPTGENRANLRGIRRLRRDGTDVFVDIVLSRMETVHGTLIAAAIRDVSERQKMHDELHQAKAFADTVIESVSGLFYVLDHEGKYFRWNKAIQMLLGLSDDEMRRTHALSTVHKEDREMVGNKIAEAFRDGHAMTEARLLTMDGSIHTVLSGRRVEIDGAVYLVGSGADITGRKRAEENIRQLSLTLEQRVQKRTAELSAANANIEKLAIVATHCQHGVVIADAEGRTEWVNEAFERLTGFSSKEVVGQKAGSLLHGPRTDPATLQAIRRGLKARENISVEIINYTKNGREFWNALKINPVYNRQGELIRFVGTQTDITERKEAEENLLRARQTAERASQAKSEFLATMSHELRTPLNGILGMNELLLRSDLNERQHEFAKASSSSGKLLMQLINDILDLSKIEAGRLELDPRECDFEALIEDVIEIFSHSAQQEGLSLNCRLDPEACVIGICDDSRLRQVLVNLVANALKFTSSGGVTITGSGTPQADGTTRLRVAVSDTGIGIPEERLDRLFKSFSQVDSSTTRRFGGTGLGLSICHQLIELMGGEIGVESQVGVGSAFWFEIPLEIIADNASSRKGEPSQPDPVGSHATPNRTQRVSSPMEQTGADACENDEVAVADPPPPTVAGHILVAEDNSINQLYIVEILKYLNCTCEVAANGEEALAAVERQSYGLILMDCQMPEMDGFAATQEIRRREAVGQLSGHLPIVALTANALKGDKERCLDAGMDDYLSKPVEHARLQQVLQKYLSGRS